MKKIFKEMWREILIALGVLSLALLLSEIGGCSLFGGTATNPLTKPVAKLETELETAKKDIDKSQKQLEGITGDVSMFEQRFNSMETTLTTIQNQVSIVQTETRQYNESLKGIMWTIAGIWVAIKMLAFIQMIIAAKVMPGKTIKNVFTLPWEKK